MWKAQKTSRNVAQIRHTGYNQKCKEISPISYGKSKRQTSLKFIQYKFQGHKASRRGIVADQVQLGSISIQPMADPLTNSEFYRSHRTQSPAFNVSAPRSWEISRSQDHARRGLKFIDFIVKWPNMPRTSANCPNNCYAQLPNICYLKSKISRIQKDPKGVKRIQKVEPGRAGEDCDHHPWGLRSAPIGPAYGTQLPSEIKVLHKEPPKHLLQDGSIADTTDTIQRYSKIFKVHRTPFFYFRSLSEATDCYRLRSGPLLTFFKSRFQHVSAMCNASNQTGKFALTPRNPRS